VKETTLPFHHLLRLHFPCYICKLVSIEDNAILLGRELASEAELDGQSKKACPSRCYRYYCHGQRHSVFHFVVLKAFLDLIARGPAFNFLPRSQQLSRRQQVR
jgi:hypothetical protein